MLSITPFPREGTETRLLRRQGLELTVGSITPFPREGTETRTRNAHVKDTFAFRIDNPISPRGDGNPYRSNTWAHTRSHIDNPISPRGDGNFICSKQIGIFIKSITPFPREGTETFENHAKQVARPVESITPFPREGTETRAPHVRVLPARLSNR